GVHLARRLVDEGADVMVSDVLDGRADALARELQVPTVRPDAALFEPCDLLAPCALGGVFSAETIPHLRCRAIVGAANNQLRTASADGELADRGILYAPDFVVNAGGIINIAEEFVGYDRERAFAHTAEIANTTSKVLTTAAERDITPLRAAERLARQRIAQEG